MNRFFKNAAVMAALFLVALVLPAQAQVETSAKQAIIVDVETGVILFEKNANERMPTSSMSKVMTTYMLFEELKRARLKFDDRILVSEKAWRMGGSKMFIHVNDRVKVEDLVRGIVIQSGNDATVAVAEGLAGTEEAFAEAMTARARELGMKNTRLKNASGWPDPDHYSTAHDLAILAHRIIADFPEYYHYFAERDFTYNKIKQQNRDPLLGRVPGADGLKTGHTEAAGYGLMGSAIRDGHRVILVINGLESEKARVEESVRLLEWAFRNFDRQPLVKEDETVDRAPVWLGRAADVPLVVKEKLDVVVPRARRSEVRMSVTYDTPISAPIKKGTEVGKLKIEIPQQAPIEVALLTGADVPRLGFFGRAKNRAQYLLFDRTE